MKKLIIIVLSLFGCGVANIVGSRESSTKQPVTLDPETGGGGPSEPGGGGKSGSVCDASTLSALKNALVSKGFLKAEGLNTPVSDKTCALEGSITPDFVADIMNDASASGELTPMPGSGSSHSQSIHAATIQNVFTTAINPSMPDKAIGISSQCGEDDEGSPAVTFKAEIKGFADVSGSFSPTTFAAKIYLSPKS